MKVSRSRLARCLAPCPRSRGRMFTFSYSEGTRLQGYSNLIKLRTYLYPGITARKLPQRRWYSKKILYDLTSVQQTFVPPKTRTSIDFSNTSKCLKTMENSGLSHMLDSRVSCGLIISVYCPSLCADRINLVFQLSLDKSSTSCSNGVSSSM